MLPFTAHLKMLRYYDRLVIQGKRLVVGDRYTDPCNHQGHESVLGWLTTYVEDSSLLEESYLWDGESLGHLQHVMRCRHCMNRVFSVGTSDMKGYIDPFISRAAS